MPQLKRDSVIYLDTNVFIEAERSECLNSITGYYDHLCTVDQVIEELNTGLHGSSDNIKVNTDSLEVEVNHVTPLDQATLKLQLAGEIELDAGGFDLLAKIINLGNNSFFVCSPDTACVRAAHFLGFGEKVISLEELVDLSGKQNIRLQDHFGKKWLGDLRLDILSCSP